MSNAKLERLKAAWNVIPSGSVSVTIGTDKEVLTAQETTAILEANWPDDPTAPPTIRPAVVNYPNGVFVHKSPDMSVASRYGDRGFRTPVTIEVGTEQNNMVQMTDSLWIAESVIDVLYIDNPPQAISVPYRSQWETDATRFRDDCGPACVEMIREWLGLPRMDIDTLSAQTGLATSDVGLPTEALVNLAARNGASLTLHNRATLGAIVAELRAGRPLIALIEYGAINRALVQDKKFLGGHFVVVVGCTNSTILINDPDWGIGANQMGHNMSVPLDQFVSALATAPVPYQATFVSPDQPKAVNVIIGYDISHHNDVNIATLAKSAGFIAHKCSEGTYETDPLQLSRRLLARQANPDVRWIVTHFGTGGDVSQQVKRLQQSAQLTGAEVVALDLERNPDTASDSEGNMSLVQAAQWALALKGITGVMPMIYTRKSWIDEINDKSGPTLAAVSTLSQCPVWLASEDNNPQPTLGRDSFEFQQYAQTQPPGATAVIDTDKWCGDWEGFDGWWKYQTSRFVSPPVEIKPAAYSRHTIHYMSGGNWDTFARAAQNRAAVGAPIPGVLICSLGWGGEPTPESAIACGIKEVIWRDYVGGSQWGDWQDEKGSYTEGYTHVLNMRLPTGSLASTYIQIINEPTAVGPGTITFWQGAMDAAKKRGIKLAVGCFSVGFPQMDFWPTFYDVLRRVRDEGHRFMLHEYRAGKDDDAGPDFTTFAKSVLDPWTGLRHQYIYAAFPDDLKKLPLVIGEFMSKVATKIPIDWYMGAVHQYTNAVADDPVLWIAHWTRGNGGAQSWNVSQLSDDQVAVIVKS